jgi:hypothetical protein
VKAFAKISVALAIAAIAATSGSAQTFRKYGSKAGWEIAVNESMGPGCLLTRSSGNAQIQMGIDATADQRGYMAVYVKGSDAVSAGETLAVAFDVDGETFTGKAFGQQLKGFNGAYVPVNNPEFIYDLAKKRRLTITPEGRDPIVVSLAGTEAAFTALRQCQEAEFDMRD